MPWFYFKAMEVSFLSYLFRDMFPIIRLIFPGTMSYGYGDRFIVLLATNSDAKVTQIKSLAAFKNTYIRLYLSQLVFKAGTF